MNQAEIHATYQQLIHDFNQARLVGFSDRVPLLRQVLDALGHPEQYFHVIHIAGTNGKGATGAMLSAILEAQGYRVGRFNSPAILNDREQLQVNHQWISEAEFLDSYDEIAPAVKRMGLKTTDVSIFEWQFLVALTWFRNQNVTYAILEAGLGGLTDATNAISVPQVTVFTKIAMDHMQILGDTLTKIATQKAKIIKPGTVAVTIADQAPEAMAVLQNEAAQQGVTLVAPQATATIQAQDLTGMVINATSDLFNWQQLAVNLLGEFQIQNIGLVLSVIAVLRRKNVMISDTAVRTGLQHVHLPDRLAVVQQKPLIMVDVAHNPDGMTNLVQSIKPLISGRSLTLIIGFLADKAVDQMLQTLLPLAHRVFTVTPDNPQRAMTAETLAARCHYLAPDLSVVETDMSHGLLQAKAALPANGVILVTGSFYVARELAALGVTGRD